ncbi:UNKNOWN [Stylonychia lemnae]|uniref:3-hydroxyisobutyryl-CoA hydrolase n=1 Tax=Stylonychia lemnae TaxID=5949 RepID=A0A077ZXR1_STYLE|nr:UNKNOWN [Stylonychia lemnae]|eukprot:CDW74362.1 UNKNOWN [Stylonychia lemnae]
MNHLTINMLEILLKQLKYWNSESQINTPKVLLMEGAGDQAFCSGGNMRGLYDAYIGVRPREYQGIYTGTLYNVDYLLHNMNQIHVCIWNGYVFGSGAGICTSAPVRIACENTQWSMPECVAGFLVDNATSIFFAQLKGGGEKYICLGLYLAITGKRVTGNDLIRWGICTHYMEKNKIQKFKEEVTKLESDQINLLLIQSIADKYSSNQEINELPQDYEIIKEIFQPDSIQKIVQRLIEYKDQTDPFIQDTKMYIEKNSPISMAICFELVIRGQFMTKKEALELDYKVGQGLLNYPDYFEGVKMLLVEKDRNKRPKWTKNSVFEVTKEDLHFFFNYPDDLKYL